MSGKTPELPPHRSIVVESKWGDWLWKIPVALGLLAFLFLFDAGDDIAKLARWVWRKLKNSF